MKKIALLFTGMFVLNAHSFETKRFEDFMVKWQAGQDAKQAQDRQPVTVLVRDTHSEETIEIKTALAVGEAVQCNLNGQGEANVWQMRDGRTPCIVRTSKGGGTLMEGKLVGTKINGGAGTGSADRHAVAGAAWHEGDRDQRAPFYSRAASRGQLHRVDHDRLLKGSRWRHKSIWAIF